MNNKDINAGTLVRWKTNLDGAVPFDTLGIVKSSGYGFIPVEWLDIDTQYDIDEDKFNTKYMEVVECESFIDAGK